MQSRVPAEFVTLRSKGAKATIDTNRVIGFIDNPDGGTYVFLQGMPSTGSLIIDEGHDQLAAELAQAKERAREQLNAEVTKRAEDLANIAKNLMDQVQSRDVCDGETDAFMILSSDARFWTGDGKSKDANAAAHVCGCCVDRALAQAKAAFPDDSWQAVPALLVPVPAGVAEVRRTVRHSVARNTQDVKDAAAAGYDAPRFVVRNELGNFLTDSGAADHSGPPRLFRTRTEAHSLASVASLRFPENAWRVLSLAEAESEARRPRADDPDVLSVIGCALSLVKAIEKDPAACSQLVQDMATGLRVELDHFINVFDDAKAKPAAQHTA